MPNVTTCTKCGKAYEAGSEEQANEQERFCPCCRKGTKRNYQTPTDMYEIKIPDTIMCQAEAARQVGAHAGARFETMNVYGYKIIARWMREECAKAAWKWIEDHTEYNVGERQENEFKNIIRKIGTKGT